MSQAVGVYWIMQELHFITVVDRSSVTESDAVGFKFSNIHTYILHTSTGTFTYFFNRAR